MKRWSITCIECGFTHTLVEVPPYCPNCRWNRLCKKEEESQCECHGDVECAYCTGVEEE